MSDGPSRQAGTERRAATLFIMVTVFLDVMAMSMGVPVMPRLIESIGHIDLAQTSKVFGIFAAMFAASQFIASPVQGVLSDRFGRRPIILASNLGLGIDFMVLAVAPNLAWLFAWRAIGGFLSGSGPAAYAYIADVAAPDQRAGAFGRLSAAAALGTAIGPAFGGALATYGLRVPFMAAACLSLLNTAYGLFVLPESLQPEQRADKIIWSRIHPVGAFHGLFKAYPRLIMVGAAALIFTLAAHAVNTIAVLYTMDRYQWTAKDIGFWLAAIAAGNMVVQAWLVGPTIKQLGEWRAMVLGFSLMFSSVIVLGLAPNGTWYWIGALILVPGGIANPAAMALESRIVKPSDQGRMAGALTSLGSLAGLVGPIVFTQLFAVIVTTRVLPLGTPFFLSAALGGIALIIQARALRPVAIAKVPRPSSSTG